MNPLNAMLLVAVVAVTIMTLDHARGVPDELAREQQTYCEMVQTFKETNGQYGWPDYRGVARKVCK